jgi:hypothetical protein
MALAVQQWDRDHLVGGLVVQEQLAGEDVSVDVLADEGTIVVAVARTRMASLGGLCVEGTLRPLAARERSVVETIVGGLRWSSLANVQLVTSPDGPAVYRSTLGPRARSASRPTQAWTCWPLRSLLPAGARRPNWDQASSSRHGSAATGSINAGPSTPRATIERRSDASAGTARGGATVHLWDESDNPAGRHKQSAAKAVCGAAIRDGSAPGSNVAVLTGR